MDFPKMDGENNVENPIKIDDWNMVPLYSETPILILDKIPPKIFHQQLSSTGHP